MPWQDASVWQSWSSVLQIFLVNLALSGDNAVVVALAARRLPDSQRRQAMFWGVSCAVVLRMVLSCAATFLIAVPGLLLVGGVVLYFIAYKLLAGEPGESAFGEAPDEKSPSNLAGAVRMICVADLVMSLDNVLAVAGASGGDQVRMLIGLASSVVFILLLSNVIAVVMDRWQWLVYAGAAVLALTAAEMILPSPDTTVASGQAPNVPKDLQRHASLAASLCASLPPAPPWLATLGRVLAVGSCLGLGFVKRRARAGQADSGEDSPAPDRQPDAADSPSPANARNAERLVECGMRGGGIHHRGMADCVTDGRV